MENIAQGTIYFDVYTPQGSCVDVVHLKIHNQMWLLFSTLLTIVYLYYEFVPVFPAIRIALLKCERHLQHMHDKFPLRLKNHFFPLKLVRL